MELTKRQLSIGKFKTDYLVEKALELNPSIKIERVDDLTVIINGVKITCTNFHD